MAAMAADGLAAEPRYRCERCKFYCKRECELGNHNRASKKLKTGRYTCQRRFGTRTDNPQADDSEYDILTAAVTMAEWEDHHAAQAEAAPPPQPLPTAPPFDADRQFFTTCQLVRGDSQQRARR